MKHLVLTTIAAVLLVGCGESQQSVPAPEAKPVKPVAEAAKPEPTIAKAPDTSIHRAVTEGNIEAIKQHLAAGTDINTKVKGGTRGGTPLHWAILNNNKKIIELLITNGADVNAKANANNKKTPLDWAISYNSQPEIVELLISKGADVNARRNDGSTPLDWADGEIADLLRKHGGKHGTIRGAARGGDIEAVKEFLAAGADVNAINIIGLTPLDSIARLPYKDIADLLRKHGGKTGEELKAEGK